jgi:outer membrane protein assembly factor BamB
MLKFNPYFFTLFFFALSAHSQEIVEWRGKDRKGVYHETGLLKQWPESGPQLLWYTDSLPSGHSSVSIANNAIYLTGKEDSMDVLIALEMNGKFKWKTPYGRAWNQSFPESRCTPTIEGTNIYLTSGLGDVACVDAITGKIKWERKICEEYKATFSLWGVAESPIIINDKFIVSPIGEKTTTIALNKHTGETIWESKCLNDSLAYVSPILVNYANKNIIVNVSASNIYGVDASDGKMLWNFKYFDVKTPEWHPRAPIINCVTPLYNEGYVYVTSGYNHAGAMLKLSEDASSVELMWSDTILDTHHGGVVKVGDYIYGSNWINNAKGNWCCINWKTGQANFETEWETKGSIIANDGMLYCYDEKKGNLALVKANPEKFEIISSYKIPYGRGPYWSHPVIKDGIIYVRHGNALMAYDLKKKS